MQHNHTGPPQPMTCRLMTRPTLSHAKSAEGEVFVPAFLLRKVSALMSPTGKETVLPLQLFACANCNHINEDMLPIE